MKALRFRMSGMPALTGRLLRWRSPEPASIIRAWMASRSRSFVSRSSTPQGAAAERAKQNLFEGWRRGPARSGLSRGSAALDHGGRTLGDCPFGGSRLSLNDPVDGSSNTWRRGEAIGQCWNELSGWRGTGCICALPIGDCSTEKAAGLTSATPAGGQCAWSCCPRHSFRAPGGLSFGMVVGSRGKQGRASLASLLGKCGWTFLVQLTEVLGAAAREAGVFSLRSA